MPWMVRNKLEHGAFTVAGAVGQNLVAQTAVFHYGNFVFYDPRNPPNDPNPKRLQARKFIQARSDDKQEKPWVEVTGVGIHARLMEELKLSENEADSYMRDIAIDANHDIYVVSSMVAVDTFPSAWFANSYQSQVRGGRDALVAKIRGDGSGVAWATFLGGSGDEGNTNTVMVDGSGVYVAMFTLSPDAPTPNGFDHTLSGHSDIYLAKLTLDGSRLLYATYSGGSGGEDTETHQLALDAQGNAFVAVPSSSSDAPTTSGAYQTRFGGGLHDVLVAKVASDGHLVAATYVGGSGNDWAEGVDVDAAGNVYFTGATDSPNFPTSGGQGPGGSTDIIAVALSNNLSKLNFSRRLGGSGNERGRTVAATAKGFFVGGQTDSPNWPTRLPIQSSLGGDLDGVVTDFVPAP
jgi:hypothetical protein